MVEPAVRVTRLRGNGQSFSAGLALDAITGASPSGAMPTGRVMTTTSASGTTTTHAPGRDPHRVVQGLSRRAGLGLEPTARARSPAPISPRTTRARSDYQSMGGTAKLSLDLMQKLTNVTLGGDSTTTTSSPWGGTRGELTDAGIAAGGGSGAPDDGVSSGARAGLAEATGDREHEHQHQARVASGVVGLSRVLTRRWMVAVNASRIVQRGYLTEPYKIVSVIDPDSGTTVGASPSSDRRRAIATGLPGELGLITSSVACSIPRTAITGTTGAVRSHTVDLEVPARARRTDLLPAPRALLHPDRGGFLPLSASSRASRCRRTRRATSVSDRCTAVTLGGTSRIPAPDQPGEFTVRVEYMLQWGDRASSRTRSACSSSSTSCRRSTSVR